MKYGNVGSGYDLGMMKREDPWWSHPIFPLVPQFEYRKGDEWDANGWCFSWLWFRLWSLEHFALEISAEIDESGVNVRASLPWLRVIVRVIPFPYSVSWKIFGRLRRKPAKARNYD